MSQIPEVRLIEGDIFFEGNTAVLRENEDENSLLILDSPPLGNFNIEDIAGAANLYRDFLNLHDGDPIKLLGIRGSLHSRPIILIVRVISN